jgi:hypothetical protein
VREIVVPMIKNARTTSPISTKLPPGRGLSQSSDRARSIARGCARPARRQEARGAFTCVQN